MHIWITQNLLLFYTLSAPKNRPQPHPVIRLKCSFLCISIQGTINWYHWSFRQNQCLFSPSSSCIPPNFLSLHIPNLTFSGRARHLSSKQKAAKNVECYYYKTPRKIVSLPKKINKCASHISEPHAVLYGALRSTMSQPVLTSLELP